jgi:hypothetical protein
MRTRLGFVLGSAVLALTAAAQPTLVEVTKIWDQGPHNAFTDLVRFNDAWYCAFRESDAHVGGNGKIRILTSADGVAWEPAALLEETGIDLRDPKLSVTPENRLMALCGGSVYEGTTLKGRQPRVAFSDDGRSFSPTERIMREGDWLWRVTWHDGRCYGVSYAADKNVYLVSSADGRQYEIITVWCLQGEANETTLRFMDDGTMVALIRRDGTPDQALIGHSSAPFINWTWSITSYNVGGPEFIILPDGAMWAAGRHYPGGATTQLFRMTMEDVEPVLLLPSGGDTSYPGMVWHDGMIWMSYYASHEGKSSIYLAKIKVN